MQCRKDYSVLFTSIVTSYLPLFFDYFPFSSSGELVKNYENFSVQRNSNSTGLLHVYTCMYNFLLKNSSVFVQKLRFGNAINCVSIAIRTDCHRIICRSFEKMEYPVLSVSESGFVCFYTFG